MTNGLAQRKYRLAVALAGTAGRNFGLPLLTLFAILVAVTALIRANSNEIVDFTTVVLVLLPFAVIATSWGYLTKLLPRAIALGMTRQEFLTGFALFGAMVVTGSVLLTQLIAVTDMQLFGLLEDDAVYGIGVIEATTRASLYFTCGMFAGALIVRCGGRMLGSVLTGLLVGTVLFREIALQLTLAVFRELGARETDSVFDSAATQNLIAPLDTVLACVFAAAAALLILRAPMPAKRA